MTNSSQSPATLDALNLDSEGFLVELKDWTPDIAQLLAGAAGIELTEDHWELINLVRAFYAATDVSPAMRPLVKLAKDRLGPEKGTSLHLNLLFPDGAAKHLSRIAGLPKPTNCL